MKRNFFLILIYVFLQIPCVQAAQDAMISVNEASIYEKPTRESAILETKKTGAKIRISNFTREGWYKTKASTGQFGWIWQSDIAVQSLSSDVRAAGLEFTQHPKEKRINRENPTFHIKAGGFFFPMFSGDVSERFSLGKFTTYSAIGPFGEIGTKISDQYRIGIRLMTYSSQSTITYRGVLFDTTLASTPILFGIERILNFSQSFDFAVGLYGGIGLNNKIQIEAVGQPIRNYFIYEKSYAAGMMTFSAKYWFNRWISAILEPAFFYTRVPTVRIADFNGDTVLRNGQGELPKITAAQWGLIFNLGIEIAF